MHFVDTHIHLQDYNSADIKNVVTNANKNNVCEFINLSANPNDWNKVINIAACYKNIIPALGVHPWYIDQAQTGWLQNLENLLQTNPNLWIGECGIDRLKNNNISQQLEILQAEIGLAKKYCRPLIMHAVKADEILRPILHLLPPKTIFHSFTGSSEWGLELQKKGFFLGLNFSILHKKNYVNILRRLNPRLLFLETDGPYQSGVPNTQSLPQNLPLLAAEIAEIFNLTPAEFLEILYTDWLVFKGEKNA